MQISSAGIRLIMDLEGISNKRYKDSAGLDTIGVGHLILDNDPNLHKVTGISNSDEVKSLTDAQIMRLLELDLVGFIAEIDRVGVIFTQSQFDALVSIVFNIGVGNFRGSTLFKLLSRHKGSRIPDSRVEDISQEFGRWRYAGKKEIRGLLVRRLIETFIFLDKANEDAIIEGVRASDMDYIISVFEDYKVNRAQRI